MSVACKSKALSGVDGQRYLCQLCKLGVHEESAVHLCAHAEEGAQPAFATGVCVDAPQLPQVTVPDSLCLSWAAGDCGHLPLGLLPPLSRAFSRALCLAKAHLVTLQGRASQGGQAFSLLT